MKQAALTEAIGSTGEFRGETARGTTQLVTIRVTGCGMTDEESFEVGDVKTARTAMRKLMAAAIRQFGRAESDE
jgi:hypothetical protein